MKKTLAIFLMVIFALVLFVGCKKAEPKQEAPVAPTNEVVAPAPPAPDAPPVPPPTDAPQPPVEPAK